MKTLPDHVNTRTFQRSPVCADHLFFEREARHGPDLVHSLHCDADGIDESLMVALLVPRGGPDLENAGREQDWDHGQADQRNLPGKGVGNDNSYNEVDEDRKGRGNDTPAKGGQR